MLETITLGRIADKSGESCYDNVARNIYALCLEFSWDMDMVKGLLISGELVYMQEFYSDDETAKHQRGKKAGLYKMSLLPTKYQTAKSTILTAISEGVHWLDNSLEPLPKSQVDKNIREVKSVKTSPLDMCTKALLTINCNINELHTIDKQAIVNDMLAIIGDDNA